MGLSSQKGGIATKMDKLVAGTRLGELARSVWDMCTLEKPSSGLCIFVSGALGVCVGVPSVLSRMTLKA